MAAQSEKFGKKGKRTPQPNGGGGGKPSSGASTVRAIGTPARQDRNDSYLGALMDSGEFRGLYVRAGVLGTITWTLKADLDVGGPVYMHGVVRHFDELPELLEELLAKGDWRVDRYAT